MVGRNPKPTSTLLLGGKKSRSLSGSSLRGEDLKMLARGHGRDLKHPFSRPRVQTEGNKHRKKSVHPPMPPRGQFTKVVRVGSLWMKNRLFISHTWHPEWTGKVPFHPLSLLLSNLGTKLHLTGCLHTSPPQSALPAQLSLTKHPSIALPQQPSLTSLLSFKSSKFKDSLWGVRFLYKKSLAFKDVLVVWWSLKGLRGRKHKGSELYPYKQSIFLIFYFLKIHKNDLLKIVQSQ